MDKDLLLNYEDLSFDHASEQRVGPPAGIFLLDGGYHVAVHGTRAAARLRDCGAVLVADLRFDPVDAARAASGGARYPHAPDLAPFSVRGLRAESRIAGRS